MPPTTAADDSAGGGKKAGDGSSSNSSRDKRLEDILRLIELCRNIQSSSVNPFEVDIREKLLVLKKHLPDWNIIDVMLKDSEAMQQLVQIVKLQSNGSITGRLRSTSTLCSSSSRSS